MIFTAFSSTFTSTQSRTALSTMGCKQLLLCLALVASLAVGESKSLQNKNSNDVQLNKEPDIPTEYQFQCKSGPGSYSVTCDRRSQVCVNYAMAQCQDCKVDICAFADGKDFEATRKQCKQECPLYWDKIKDEVDCREFEQRCAASTTMTMTEAEPCAGVQAENEKLTQELKHKDDTISALTVTVVLLVVLVLALLGVVARTQLMELYESLSKRVVCEKVGPTDGEAAPRPDQGTDQDGEENQERLALVQPDQDQNIDEGENGAVSGLNNVPPASDIPPFQTAKMESSSMGD